MSKVDLDPSKMLGFKILDKETQSVGPAQRVNTRIEAKVGGKPIVGAHVAKLGSKVGAKVGVKPA